MDLFLDAGAGSWLKEEARNLLRSTRKTMRKLSPERGVSGQEQTSNTLALSCNLYHAR